MSKQEYESKTVNVYGDKFAREKNPVPAYQRQLSTRPTTFTCIVRESGYLVMVLRNKNATVSRGGKTENASIRQMRGSLVKTGTEDGQVTIESSIIKGVDANMDGGAIAGNG